MWADMAPALAILGLVVAAFIPVFIGSWIGARRYEKKNGDVRPMEGD